jgi:anti-sigma B factor antagonist
MKMENNKQDNQLSTNLYSDGDLTIIEIAGYLDAHTAVSLEQFIGREIEKGNYKFIIDFAGLEYISSAGLGVFMSHIEAVRKKGGDIKMCKMQDKVYSIFDLLGFHVLYDICKEMDEAKDKFNN